MDNAFNTCRLTRKERAVCTINNLWGIGTKSTLFAISVLVFLLILLFISYKFVKGFLATICLLLVISSWNFHFFFIWPGTKFQLDLTKDNDSPHRPPIIKIAHFCNVMSIMGIYGENLCLLSDQESFFPGHIKNVDTHYEPFS